VTPEDLDAALAATPGAAAAIVVSPTYFGAVADVRGLAGAAHAHGVALVVDEAWGAHLAFSRALPEHALAAGADLVISSTHKHAGSLTQSAMLHLGGGGDLGFDETAIDHALRLVSSTSPSSLLIASLDAARRHAAVHGGRLLPRQVADLAALRRAIRRLPGLDVLDERVVGSHGVAALDPLRVCVDVRATGLRGHEVARRLRADDVHVELSGEHVLVAVFGLGEGVALHGDRLLKSLARACTPGRGARPAPVAPARQAPPWGPAALSPRSAFLAAHERVPVAAAEGRIAAECLAAYPPGIPNVLPGERLTAANLAILRRTLDHGGVVRGAADPTLATLLVVAEPALGTRAGRHLDVAAA
jgi:lysine decarboxylase